MKKISNKFHPGAQTISFFFGDLFFGIALKLEKVGSKKNFVRLSSPLYTFFLRDYNRAHSLFLFKEAYHNAALPIPPTDKNLEILILELGKVVRSGKKL